MNFLRYHVHFENEENSINFEKETQQVIKRSETMGIEELLLDRATKLGIREGEQKKSQDVVENLLLDFGFTDEQAAKAANVPLAFVRKVRSQLKKKQAE